MLLNQNENNLDPERILLTQALSEHFAYQKESLPSIILEVLEAYHEREAQRLKAVREGFGELFQDKLQDTWKRTLTKHPTGTEAIRLMTHHIMAELDGGDGPIL